MNYPPNMDWSKIEANDADIDDHDVLALCPQCGGSVCRLYWYRNNRRLEATGDVVCKDCGYETKEQNLISKYDAHHLL